ncbi:MAG: A/G-specific adenine glycosylase, partial [Elusimicrobia bacterium]|nr:A/G-specific adenine glycosylase [Elusimicrobiota bacterium]
TPYKVWVSEIMLQQTQVETVLPYYQKFLKRFKDIRSLARASESEVLSLWSGLGYYQRARNLLKTARLILKNYGGEFPAEEQEILRLPGVGRYTAGALQSIAYHRPVPILDGNVKRVLGRIFLEESQEKLWRLSSELVLQANSEGVDPSDFNQSLMELGALICLPQDPVCPECPVQERCFAYKKGIQNKFPAPKDRKKTVTQSHLLFLIRRNHNGLTEFLLRQISQKAGWFKGMWEFPMVLNDGNGTKSKFLKSLSEVCGQEIKVGQKLGHFSHTITHHRLDISVVSCRDCYETPSFPRKRESREEIPQLDSRFRGNDVKGGVFPQSLNALNSVSNYRWMDKDKMRTLPSSTILRKALALTGKI